MVLADSTLPFSFGVEPTTGTVEVQVSGLDSRVALGGQATIKHSGGPPDSLQVEILADGLARVAWVPEGPVQVTYQPPAAYELVGETPAFQEGVLSMAESILPSNVYGLLESTLRDMFIKRKALQLLGILIALYFATNAINVLIVAFNNTYHAIESRSWIERRAIAAFLVIIMFFLITTAVSLIIFSRSAINLLDSKDIIQKAFTLYLFRIGKWIVIIAMIYSALSFLYWLGPSRKMKWKFYSAGSTLASVLVILTSLIFSSIINNFGQFNKFYGSIGTLMVILLWLYFNSIALLIGFELNASIKGAKLEMNNTLPEEITEEG